MLSGISQGSMLGPFLFLIYINGIIILHRLKCHLYADDCILYKHIGSLHDTVSKRTYCNLNTTESKQYKMLFNIDTANVVLPVTLK